MSYLASEKRQLISEKGSFLGCRFDLRFPLIPLTFFIGISLYPSWAGAELYFNPRFLADDPSAVADLSAFEKGQEVPEGTYRVDVYLNDGYLFTRDVRFVIDGNNKELSPCVTQSELAKMGVNTLAIPEISKLAKDTCEPLTSLVTDSTARFDVGLQRLNITVPQLFMKDRVRDFIPPELWDSGITAGILNYSLTGSNARNQDGKNSSYSYLNLQSGLNFGAWRLRDNSTWSHSTGSANSETRWEHINTYLERGINQIRSRLTIGDSYTPGDIFDSFNFRGIQLASDDNMLPESQRGFAPVIRGMAQGTADVSIKQNGYEIYRNTFPPGPFVINDLYAAGSSGDLQVTITEADGSTKSFTVPYSSVPLLQREGHTQYAVTVGDYRSGNGQQEKPTFLQGTVMRGLSYGWTLYGGTQLANRYQAINAGIGKNIGIFGALSVDITHANAKLPDDSNHEGQSIRFLYNKSLNETGTIIQLAGYRYSTKGYYSFADTTYKRMDGYNLATQDGVIYVTPKFSDYYNLAYNKREKVQLSLTQQIGEQSTLYVTGSHETYWNTSKSDKQLQVGINTLIEGINWGLSYSLSKNSWQESNDQMLALNVNIPFSHWLRSDSQSIWRNASASYNVSHDLKGRMTNTAGLYGTLLEDNNLSYSVQTGYSGGGQGTSSATGYTSLNYRGAYGNANVGYSYTDSFRQIYYGFSGGILAHANGVTLSQPMNDTVVLVKAPGAGHVKVENQTGVETDWRGYAVLPYATEYRENRIALNTNTLANNVDLEDPVVSVVPTRGAVVRADFHPKVGVKVLMTLLRNGKPVPFGAVVSSEENSGGSIVADDGQVYLTGLPLSGQLIARWGDGPDAQCHVNYTLPEQSQQEILSKYRAECL
ncbi:Outer membrane usher protein fimD precursor [Providencia rustigianii]|uniref:Outer membrane usher protein fimD n=1 Tax=Providencia rustigianii TaxID=158850 RepID=A0A379FZB1_9GAMM|nr:fimbrial biogenesis usher protein [Providencia rustigianii]SUC34001.1 Outer membrane usher protein fimD precursor [Providencia rustigianii]